jgi:hypothetical protein
MNRELLYASYPHPDRPGVAVFVRNHAGVRAILQGVDGERPNLCDWPDPSREGRTSWWCACCVVSYLQGGPRPQRDTVTIRSAKIPAGWLGIPVCASHQDPPEELRQAALMLMFMEQKFKATSADELCDDNKGARP